MLLIYGANGYTAGLIAEAAVQRGMRPVLAGRSEAVRPIAAALGLEGRVFSLADAAAHLDGVVAVLHCAGPFAHTWQPMAGACLAKNVHYLDITGEARVFEALAQKSAEAENAGVMLMPGVGYDVVPSDCLAAHLKRRLPSATQLTLAMQNLSHVSRGTATTIVENMPSGGLVRREGVLTRVPAAWKTRTIDLGAGPVKAMTIPWGDVASAYYSTGIANIEVYLAAPFGMRVAARLSRFISPLLGMSLVQNFFKRRIQAGPPGPTAEQRARGKSFLWGEAVDVAGNVVQSRLEGPDGYTLTVEAALAVVARVLQGEVRPGYQTPSMVYGPDFVLEIPGVRRLDVM